jgi:hypothetical protein
VGLAAKPAAAERAAWRSARQAGTSGLTGNGQSGSMSALALHILQLFFGHAEVMPQFMHERLADLLSHFSLIGADRLNVFLMQHDVGRTG